MKPDIPISIGRLKAISHPLRLSIILFLAERGPTTVMELVDYFEIKHCSAVSQCLIVLRRVGLVTREKKSTRRIYSLGEGAIELVADLRHLACALDVQ